jgi:hypothetical protein
LKPIVQNDGTGEITMYESNKIDVLLITDSQVAFKKIQRQFMDTSIIMCRLIHSGNITSTLYNLEVRNFQPQIIILDLNFIRLHNIEDTFLQLKETTNGAHLFLLTNNNETEQTSLPKYISENVDMFVRTDQINALSHFVLSTIFPYRCVGNA